MTSEEQNNELVKQVQDLTQRLDHLTDLYFRQNFIDKTVFQNPVYFNGKVYFKDGSILSLGATTGAKLGLTGDKIAFLGATPSARLSAITAPSGGATIDSQARTAIGLLITALQTFGLTS